MKIILILLLKNLPHQKLSIIPHWYSDDIDIVGSRPSLAFSQQTLEQIQVTQQVILSETS